MKPSSAKKKSDAQLSLVSFAAAKGAAPTARPPASAAPPADLAPAPTEADAGRKAAAPLLVADSAPAQTRQARRFSAEKMAQRQREISVSEFFMKNRHLLGFDSPSKALLTAVKEAVDNSLDACEEAGILPDLRIEVHAIHPPGAKGPNGSPPPPHTTDRFRIVVEDNGPGIVKAQIPKVFGQLLYGSKFHTRKQARGQQGIGISAAGMYGLLTTGKPVIVVSRTSEKKPAHHFEITIDHKRNAPVVHKDEELADWHRPHGTRVEIELQGDYKTGQRWLTRYVEMTALANPHASVTYVRPNAPPLVFPRSAEELPRESEEILSHPHGVELGQLMAFLKDSKARNVRTFLKTEFSRVSEAAAQAILEAAGLDGEKRPRDLDRHEAERLHKAMAEAKLMAPPTNCLSPIGDALMRKGLITFLSVMEEDTEEKEAQATLLEGGQQAEAEAAAPPEEGVERIKGHPFFITTVTRPPKVYRGNPFQVEVGLAYGGSFPPDKPVEVYRFANRVPLLFQRSACAATESVIKTDWRNYLLSQPKGSLPIGPMAIMIHLASVWVPFTSEAKEAIAHYPEIMKEIQLALQECGRKLAAHIRKRQHADYEAKRRSIFELYIQELGESLEKLTGVNRAKVEKDLLALAVEMTGGEEEPAEAEGAAAPGSAEKGKRGGEEAEVRE